MATIVEFIAKYWLEVIFSVISGGVGLACRWMWKQFKRDRENNRVQRDAMQALLRAEIITTYNHYEDKRYLPIYARENLHGLFEQYRALGGNGAIKSLVDRADVWPTSPDDENEED